VQKNNIQIINVRSKTCKKHRKETEDEFIN